MIIQPRRHPRARRGSRRQCRLWIPAWRGNDVLSGYPKYEFNLWNGLLVPAKTPKETIAAIHHAVVAALKAPEASKRLSEMSSTIIANLPEEFGAFLKSEVDSIAAVVRKLNLTAESNR